MSALSPEKQSEDEGLPPRQRILVALAVLPAGAMQGMDTFATGVAIPRMMGSFSVTLVEISWVLISYLVASAMFTPFYAWLSRKIGCKNLFISVASSLRRTGPATHLPPPTNTLSRIST